MKLDIFMPIYNGSKYLLKTLDSIATQDWEDFRLFRVLRKNMVILSRNSAFSWLAPLTAIHKLSVLSTHSHDIRRLVQSGAVSCC